MLNVLKVHLGDVTVFYQFYGLCKRKWRVELKLLVYQRVCLPLKDFCSDIYDVCFPKTYNRTVY